MYVVCSDSSYINSALELVSELDQECSYCDIQMANFIYTRASKLYSNVVILIVQ